MLPAIKDQGHQQAIAYVLGVQDSYRYQIRSWVKWMEEEGRGINQADVAAYFTWLNESSI